VSVTLFEAAVVSVVVAFSLSTFVEQANNKTVAVNKKDNDFI
jgi:hypothetical protein